MTRRVFGPPEPLSEVVRAKGRTPHLIRAEVLARAPSGTRPIALPFSPPGAEEPRPVDPEEREAVLMRVDVEELYAFGRPGLETHELARDLYIADGSGGALLRISDARGADSRLHPDVDLTLRTPFSSYALEPPLDAVSRTALVRVLRVGDPIYVFGHAAIEQDSAGLGPGLGAGYREAALMAVFDAQEAPLQIFDEPAYRALRAWHALPWYRKLSLLVRNR